MEKWESNEAFFPHHGWDRDLLNHTVVPCAAAPVGYIAGGSAGRAPLNPAQEPKAFPNYRRQKMFGSGQ
jgi:hypothetical protein